MASQRDAQEDRSEGSIVALPPWLLDESQPKFAAQKGGVAGDVVLTDLAAEKVPVILRFEVISNTSCKLLKALSLLCTLLALLGLAAETVLKFKKDPGASLARRNSRYILAMLSISCVLLGALVFVLGTWLFCLAAARRRGCHWDHRRRRISLLAFAQLVIQTLNCALWVAANAYIVGRYCSWGDTPVIMMGWAQWTLWNTQFLIIICQGHSGNVWRGGKWTNVPFLLRAAPRTDGASTERHEAAFDDRLILDAPMTVHSLKLVPWVLFEAVVCVATALIYDALKRKKDGKRSCRDAAARCLPSLSLQVTIGLLVAGTLVWLVIYALHMRNSFGQLRKRPYKYARLSTIMFTIQVWQVAGLFAALTLSFALLIFLRLSSCWTVVFAWFGVLPMHFAASSMSIISSWYFMPKSNLRKDKILQVWLQEFAWTAPSLPECLERRNRHLAASRELRGTPMFCMDTALRLLYWACLVYSYQEDSPGVERFSPDFALGLFGLGELELVWDRRADVKGVLGWSREQRRVVIAFRGTASLENVKTDLKLWQVVHSPKRYASVPTLWGLFRLRRVVRVHSGFYEAWAGAASAPTAKQQHLGLPQEVAMLGSLEHALDLQGDVEKAEQAMGQQEREQGQQQGQQRGQQRGQQQGQRGQGPGSQQEEGGAAGRPAGRPPGPRPGPEPRGGGQARGAAMPYNRQLLSRLEAIFEEEGVDPLQVEFLLTGHSLGGALASLCAVDLKLRWPACTVRVYTFGQPRVGNRPFAAEYARLVPGHFSVINGQDPVPRVPKSTYKRCGQRVIINGRGDLILSPTFLESTVLSGTAVVGDHMLERYRASFAAILKAQFTTKRLVGGREGVAALCQELDLGRLLRCQGLDLDSLMCANTRPVTLEAAQRRRQRQQARGHPVGATQRSSCFSCTCGPGSSLRSGTQPEDNDADAEEGADEGLS